MTNLVTFVNENDPSEKYTVDTDALFTYAEETHDPQAIEVLVHISHALCDHPEFMARAAKKHARDIKQVLFELHDFIRADTDPKNAWIEIVEVGKYRSELRYHSGQHPRRMPGVSSFTASGPAGAFLDISGEGVELVIQSVEEGLLPNTFSWEKTASPSRRKHLVRMLKDALRAHSYAPEAVKARRAVEARDATRPDLLG